MIKDIYIPSANRNQYRFETREDLISNLNRINVFIGPNNSGKSRLLRSLFSENITYKIEQFDFEAYAQKFSEFSNLLTTKIKGSGYQDVRGNTQDSVISKAENLNNLLSTAQFPTELNVLNDVAQFIQHLKSFTCNQATHTSDYQPRLSIDHVEREIQLISLAYSDLLKAPNLFPDVFEKIYIPIMRGLRPLVVNKGISNMVVDSYKERTIKDYFPGFDKKQYERNSIYTGLSFYEDSKRLLLGKNDQRKKIKYFQKFLSDNFFRGHPLELTPNEEDDCIHLSLGEEEYPIHSLGDGIQNLIILLYPLFFNNDKKVLYFAEEPEQSLHPGLQRMFIDTLLKPDFDNMQFFFTTHSNHFLDMALDHSKVSIFNFSKIFEQKKAFYKIQNTNNENLDVLNSIGVKNSSVFLSNCTIWVEGITDRLYLNKYLEVFQLSKFGNDYDRLRFKEDLHYSYVEYGGANIVHYSFDNDENWDKIKASRISNRILLVMDSDEASSKPNSKKSHRQDELKRKLGDNLIILPCREIENTLSKQTLENTLRILEKNELINLDNISADDYKNEYLGEFIDKNVIGLKHKYCAESKTINNKIKFCKTAIQEIKNAGDLSSSGLNIAKTLFEFINSHNL